MTTGIPKEGEIVRVRTRHWVVQQVVPSSYGDTVHLACADDDAQGEELEVVWQVELDASIISDENWKSIGQKGFDPPRHFAAYLNTLRWNCVTATDPRLFQSPFRAGIKVEPYQLDPLQKALQLPRVNMFIADDVGLGKTIEAGLIASELLMRRRVQDIVVACPPSMQFQWKDELDNRFGLTFEIFDREYVERIRRERGHGVNPWDTFPRFIISHRLLIDESYVGPMQVWLDNIRPGSLLILDEAHHAAPANGSKYAIDSQITKAVRNLAGRFEHRLFLSATPHNGHSNSFSSLLHILDRERFIPGVKVLAGNLEAVMVRRLKDDLRSIGVPGFPERKIVQVELPRDIGLEALPDDTPELALAALLDQYRSLRLDHMAGMKRRQRNQFELLLTQLQQRLLSSVEAFSRTLNVHKRTMERIWAKEVADDDDRRPVAEASKLQSADSDDERSGANEDVLGEMFDREAEKATLASGGNASSFVMERQLLDQMSRIAERARMQPDARVRYLIDWMQKNMCPGASLSADGGPKAGAAWTDLRVILFTEWDDTKRYLEQQLKQVIKGTHRWEERIELYHGPTPPQKKDALKLAFNTPPQEHPIRILICTDAAREGLNLQAHCYNLFHFDVPWNPSRLEQRNGRIDRKLQQAPVVYCHYFFYSQRPEDHVLKVLTRKTETIRTELGSFNEVLARKLKHGIRRSQALKTAEELDVEDQNPAHAITQEELEVVRKRHDKLRESIAGLDRRLNEARRVLNYDPVMLQDALSCSLELLGAERIRDLGGGRFELPDLETRSGADPRWSATLDTLRKPPGDGNRNFEWRRTAPIRPLVFEPPDGIDDSIVQMHLSHRLVQRLLSRFYSQGFVLNDLSRACLTQSQDSVPRVALLGRLAVYGPRAARLHEQLLTVTARWVAPNDRAKPLSPFAREAEAKTMEMVQSSLAPGGTHELSESIRKMLESSISLDVAELLKHLQPRGEEALQDAGEKLKKRGEVESGELIRILEDQRKRVLSELDKASKDDWLQLPLPLDEDARRNEELERRQRKNDIKYWQDWLENVDGDLKREPARIHDFYKVHSYRIEPIGLVYLWPAN
ncbi:MAG: DISARM system SNF2-like helicase DrmD [Verrucomicrobia bacterium]|nr:DISARM system SNF2-like helicase DrmD [Verrucomicrobiota bacterium]